MVRRALKVLVTWSKTCSEMAGRQPRPHRAGRLPTFEQPTTPADGIAHVLVNGTLAWQDGAHTGARPGRALRGQAMQQEQSA